MPLIVEIAVGYVIGRALCDVANVCGKVVVRRLVERSPTLHRWIREDTARDSRLRRLVS